MQQLGKATADAVDVERRDLEALATRHGRVFPEGFFATLARGA
jgi:hypothetical protein